jgi:homopolymeric O-antigen transport system permease protein
MKLIPPREPDVVHVRARGDSKPRILDFDSFVVETGHGIVAFFHYIRELWQRRMLVRVLAARELKSTYEMNIVGFAWWLLEPLSMTAVYYVLINILTQRGASDPTTLVQILISLLAFKWLSQSLIGSMGVVRANSSLVTDVYFPRALLPVTQIVVALAHFGVGLLTVPIFLFFAHVGLSLSMLWLPVIMAVQFLFMLGLAYPLSVWGLTYRNLPGLMSNVLRLWFYLSPGLYALSVVPAGRPRTLMQFNPLTGLFEGYRGALVTGRPPGWTLLWTAFIGALAVVFGGWYFTRREPHFGKML